MRATDDANNPKAMRKQRTIRSRMGKFMLYTKVMGIKENMISVSVIKAVHCVSQIKCWRRIYHLCMRKLDDHTTYEVPEIISSLLWHTDNFLDGGVPQEANWPALGKRNYDGAQHDNDMGDDNNVQEPLPAFVGL